MKRIHVLAVALLFGSAAVLGVVAATRTVHVGAAAQPRTGAPSIVSRSRRLAGVERQLRRALHEHPPALPAVPTVHAVPQQAVRPSAQPPAQVVYHRPPPLVVITHRAGGHEHDQESEGGDD
jgi:hypothetical protein